MTNPERIQLRQLMSNPQWAAFEKLVGEFTDKIRDEGISVSNEWGVISTTLMREGQLRGIQRLLQELYVQIETANEREDSRNEPPRDYNTDS